MSRAKTIVLSDQDRSALQNIANSQSEEARRVRRATILLLAANGETQNSIAQAVGLSRPSVILCIKKYREAGWEYALADNSRTGRPALISDAAKDWVRNTACQKPSDFGYPQPLWTIARLRKHIRKTCVEAGFAELQDVALSKVWTILDEVQSKSQRLRYYLERRVSQPESTTREVLMICKQIELLYNEDGIVIWPDEEQVAQCLSYSTNPGIQVAPSANDSPLPPAAHGGEASPREYSRLDTAFLLAGIDLQTGRVVLRFSDTNKTADFVAFLKALNKNFRSSDKIQIIMDPRAIRTPKKLRNYLETIPGRFEFVLNPKHGSWLNLIESLFGKMTRGLLGGLRVQTKEELIERINDHIAQANSEPSVYRWPRAIDEVLPVEG